MAIVTMKQFTLLAFHEHRDALLKELQTFGDVHLRNLQQEELQEMDFLRQDYSPERALELEAELERVNSTLVHIKPYAPKGKLTDKRPSLTDEAFEHYPQQYDYATVCDQVKEQDERIATIRSETARLRSENEGLRSWLELDISPAELERLDAARAIVGTINKAALESFQAMAAEEFPCAYLELLGSQKDDAAMLLLVPAEQYEDLLARGKDLGFSRSNLSFSGIPKELIEANNRRMTELEAEREQALELIKGHGDAYSHLLIAADYFRTVLAREQARENFMASDCVVLMEGWVPAEEEKKLRSLVEATCGQQYYLELAEVERDSTEVPIKLKNNKVVAAFTDITSMFSAPRYNELDPTPVLTPFYWLFFGLMVGDVGYGLILMAGTLLAGRLLDLKDGMKTFMRFFFYLSFAVILGGFIYGSFFGVTFFAPITYIDETGMVAKKALLDSGLDIQTMLIFSIALGVVHIVVGLLTKAYMCLRDGHPWDAFCDGFLWIIVLLSGICLIIGVTGLLSEGAKTAAWWIFWASLIGLALTQGRSSPSIGGKIGNGLYGAYGLTSYVGDLVSYTRVVALALSGAYIAFSFNLMATEVIPAPYSYVFGPIIAALGHALNFGLALLGAYVHTCRLQYVEFFGKFYEGGGKPFAPLKLQNNYVHIVKK